MISAVSNAIHLQAIRLQKSQALHASKLNDFARAIVVLNAICNIKLRARNAYAQSFKSCVSPNNQLIAICAQLIYSASCSQTRICKSALNRSFFSEISFMVNAVFCLRSRPLAAQCVTMFSTRPLGRSFFHSHILIFTCPRGISIWRFMWHNRTVLNYCYCNNPQPRNNQDFELTLHKS